jgi:hypothetical protein
MIRVEGVEGMRIFDPAAMVDFGGEMEIAGEGRKVRVRFEPFRSGVKIGGIEPEPRVLGLEARGSFGNTPLAQ